jgi:hypothetical protein
VDTKKEARFGTTETPEAAEAAKASQAPKGATTAPSTKAARAAGPRILLEEEVTGRRQNPKATRGFRVKEETHYGDYASQSRGCASCKA